MPKKFLRVLLAATWSPVKVKVGGLRHAGVHGGWNY